MTSPESRYRRLLALYPREFRREYGEEMLGVLLADPRRGPGQVLDLVRAAVACRLRQPFAAGRDWRRAARVAQVFGAMLLLAVALRRVAIAVAVFVWTGAPDVRPDALLILRAVAWAVVVVAALAGWRLVAAAGATAGLGAEIATPARHYLDTPATVLVAFWLIVAAAVVLIAGLVARRSGPLRGWPAMALAGVALTAHGVLPGYGGGVVSATLPDVAAVLALTTAALVAVAGARQEPAVRRRVVAWAAPVLVTVPLVEGGFGRFVADNMRHPESVRLLGPVQWAALVVIPVVTFWVVAELTRRVEAARTVSPAGGSDK